MTSFRPAGGYAFPRCECGNSAIERVAHGLLDKRALTGTDVDALITGARHGRIGSASAAPGPTP
jgi:hypothetical protein